MNRWLSLVYHCPLHMSMLARHTNRKVCIHHCLIIISRLLHEILKRLVFYRLFFYLRRDLDLILLVILVVKMVYGKMSTSTSFKFKVLTTDFRENSS